MIEHDWRLAGLRLLLALLLGGIIGLERQMKQKSAGLRTHMMVAMGSALFMEISIAVPRMSGVATSDPSRIAAQIITGIGFLGAGTILHARGFVVGLTTAASIWLAAAIGMGVGAGVYWPPILATALGVAVLVTSHIIEGRLGTNDRVQRLVVALSKMEIATQVKQLVIHSDAELLRSKVTSEHHSMVLEFDIRLPLDDQIELVEQLRYIEGVKSARIEG
ncbi:MAG: MgtC/SapB family protein [Candidatus Eisenbacteria bacterium]|nr:MgtC/SapB family protein [Candidatus Eisenbacteria bacterium]